jgi:alkanesulfonate monooxygenase SsuD/methylene tetrahydromethanopterin reductase-like flavin-dependent oxidoreductase (luciferase family)
MKSYFFSEQSYYPNWHELPGSPKITTPSGLMDPTVANRLLKDFIDECIHADRLGLNIMVNEHHAGYPCMSVSCLVTLAVLATHTKNARLLALGIPILNRMDPFRIAEEIAYVDTLSCGRLEAGLIKGTAYEAFIANANHSHGMGRFWEAHDLIIEALTHQNGAFRWEGHNFNYRYVNVIPRCYQQPHPPVWMTTLSASTARDIARRDYVLSIPGVARAARKAFPIYREEYLKFHGKAPTLDRFAFLAHVAVAKDEKTALERGRKLLEFSNVSDRIDLRFVNPPGALSVEDNAKILRSASVATHRPKTLPDGTPLSNPPTPQQQIQNELLFAGTPDQVFEQLRRLYESCGGFGNLMIQKGGEMLHDEILDSLTLFANDVQPRLEKLTLAHRTASGHAARHDVETCRVFSK